MGVSMIYSCRWCNLAHGYAHGPAIMLKQCMALTLHALRGTTFPLSNPAIKELNGELSPADLAAFNADLSELRSKLC
jgi:hypothetical protein